MNNVDFTKELNHLSLCSGYEGIGIGLRRVFPNCREVAFCEIETFAICNMVQKMEAGAIHPAPVFTNLKTFPFRKFRGCVDILSGGFPCQPFSVAGLGKGVEDPRHLFPFILDGIKQCQPRFVFLENVEGILSKYTAEGEPVLLHVLRSLEGAGYRTTWGIFSASEVGAPHQRKRIFILADSEHDGFSSDSLRGGAAEGGQREKKGQDESSNSQGAGRPGSGGDIQGGEQDGLANTNSDRGSAGIPKPEQWQERQSEVADHYRSGSLRSGPLWPSRPGEAQFAWEEPRVVADTDPDRFKGGSLPREERRKTERPDVVGTGEGSVGDSKSVSGDVSNSRDFTKEHSREGTQGSVGGVSGNDPTGEQEDGEAQSELGGAVDGSPGGLDSAIRGVDAITNRTDRLRLLGNGVLPLVAEKAFRTLYERLNNDR